MTLMRKTPKPKVCRVCRTSFTPFLPMARVCSPFCAMSIASSDRVKKEKQALIRDRKETKAKLEKLKNRAQWAKEAQSAFNEFIRLRDAALPCISCGRYHQGQYHAGHFLSVGARPELRFEESNVHKQCAPCNNHLAGNVVLYRKALLERIGSEAVDFLEGPHEPKKYTIDQLQAIKAEYAAKAKQLKEQA